MRYIGILLSVFSLLSLVRCSSAVIGEYETDQTGPKTMLSLGQDSSYSYVISSHGRPIYGSEGRWRYSKKTVWFTYQMPNFELDSAKVIGIKIGKVDNIGDKRLFQAFADDGDTTALLGATIYFDEREVLLSDKPVVLDKTLKSVKLKFLSDEVVCKFDEKASGNFYKFYIHLPTQKNYQRVDLPFDKLILKRNLLVSDSVVFRKVK